MSSPKISGCMKRQVVSVSASASLSEAAAVFRSAHIGTLPVVDDAEQLVGVLPLRRLLSLMMPDFLRLVDEFDFVHDFGAVESKHPSPEALEQPVREVMEPPIFIEETCGLLRAIALMRHHELRDLPVVNSKRRLVGIASHVDIGIALLTDWLEASEETR